MSTIARINWKWLKTKEGMIFLKRLNYRVKHPIRKKRKESRITCMNIGCPFDMECENSCDKAFPPGDVWSSGSCPCYSYDSPVDLAIILSDYYDMIKK